MKSFFFVIFSLCLLQSSTAQTTALSIFTDLAAAKAHATENNQEILMVFAGSDWCKPCIQFKKDILLSTDFEYQLADKVTILYLDFPARRKNKLPKAQKVHNEALAERFNKSGAFPKIVLINTAEEVLATPTFKGQTALDFVAELSPNLAIKE